MEVLPELPYAPNALEPFIDEQTMRLHHDKHHKAYVDTFNAAIKGTPWEQLTAEEALTRLAELPEQIRETVRNHAGGSVNHAFFWQSMTPNRQEPSSALADVLAKHFGSLEAFKEVFITTAMKRFGSGWAWLVLTRDGKLSVYSTPNQDTPLLTGDVPLLGVDVWEHAYYLKYQNRRKEHLEAFWQIINWQEVEERYANARA